MMARFADKVVLVTGASGQLGSGIARQFLLEGAKVITPVRSQTSADSVVKHVAPAGADRLEVLVSNVADEASAESVAKSVKDEYGSIDHVVSISGGWWGGGMTRCARIVAKLWQATQCHKFKKHSRPNGSWHTCDWPTLSGDGTICHAPLLYWLQCCMLVPLWQTRRQMS